MSGLLVFYLRVPKKSRVFLKREGAGRVWPAGAFFRGLRPVRSGAEGAALGHFTDVHTIEKMIKNYLCLGGASSRGRV